MLVRIDADMILRKTHVKTGITVEHDLKLYPDILREIGLVDPSRRVGPMIISEATGEPYKHRTFTQTWRRVADAAGIPRTYGIWIPALEPFLRLTMPVPTRLR